MITNKHAQSAPEDKHAIKQAQSEETILIIPADKGHGAFMLDKAVYAEKASHLLQDTTTYRSSKRRWIQSQSLSLKAYETAARFQKNSSIW